MSADEGEVAAAWSAAGSGAPTAGVRRRKSLRFLEGRKTEARSASAGAPGGDGGEDGMACYRAVGCGMRSTRTSGAWFPARRRIARSGMAAAPLLRLALLLLQFPFPASLSPIAPSPSLLSYDLMILDTA